MSKVIFNERLKTDTPTLILKRRDFTNIGIVKATNIVYNDSFKVANTLTFTAYDDNDNWDYINEHYLVFVPEYNEYFEMSVSLDEENVTCKRVVCTALAESELSQVKLYDIEINTEADIARDDYDANYPTIFYREPEEYPVGSEMYTKLKNSSLLHRILDKAPHYSIGHVDTSLKNLSTWYQFSISDTNIYDELTGEIAEQYQCVFIFDSATRTVNAYDLCNTCDDCGYRGDFRSACPECGSTEFRGAYGDDTTICITKENLATQANVEGNVSALKNCFRVSGGDDLMTATVMNSNPNRSNYLYYFSEEMLASMPEELSAKIREYNEMYEYYMHKRRFGGFGSLLDNYNIIVDYYVNYLFPDSGLSYEELETWRTYDKCVSALYDATDFYGFIQTSAMPTITTDNPTPEETLALLTEESLSPIAVSDPVNVDLDTVRNVIKKMCESIINTALYKVDVYINGYTYGNPATCRCWIELISSKDGEIIYDEEGSMYDKNFVISVTDDEETRFIQQIKNSFAKLDTNYRELTDITLTNEELSIRAELHSLDALTSVCESYSDCLSVILSSENATLMNEYYNLYLSKLKIIEEEMEIKMEDLECIQEVIDTLTIILDEVAEELNITNFFGTELWNTFCAYRKEDSYQNANYISDGLTNAELIKRASELLDAANKELYKAGNMQYTVTATVNNLLVLDEFAPLTEYFEVGNWIHMFINEQRYDLRLMSYQVDYDNPANLQVEFSTVVKTWSGDSDLEDVVKTTQSIAGSFPSFVQKVKENEESSTYVKNWVNLGLDATATNIVNNAYNQTVTFDRTGILCQKYNDVEGVYSPNQLRIINNGLYMTKDDWDSIEAGIGEFTYYDPLTDDYIQDYGIIAKKIVGKMIVGEDLMIANENASIIIDKNGITLDGASITWKTPIDGAGTDITEFENRLASCLGVTTITADSVIAPKIGGGYLKIESGSVSVTIDPHEETDLHSTKVVSIVSAYDGNVFYVNKGGNVFVKGQIEAEFGKIGKFSIGDGIYYGSGNRFKDSGGIYIGDQGISCSNTFSVTWFGILNATDACVTGYIGADNGYIGGFTLTDNHMYSGTSWMGSVVPGVYIGTDGIRLYNSEDAYVDIRDGILTATNANITGNINAETGTIAGFLIKDNAIYNGAETASSTDAGIYIGTDGIIQNGTYGSTTIANGRLISTKAELHGAEIANSIIGGTVSIDGDITITGTLKFIGWSASFNYLDIGGNIVEGNRIISPNQTYDWLCTSNGNLLPRTDTSDAPASIGNSTGYVSNFYYQTMHQVSDERRKHDIRYMSDTDATDLILNAKPCSYVYNDDTLGVTKYGLIAQDVRDYLRSTGKGINGILSISAPNGEDERYLTDLYADESSVTYGIDYIEYIAPLIKTSQYSLTSIAELQEEVFSLRHELAQAQFEIEELKSQVVA